MFKLKSKFKPGGDQPSAIESLGRSFEQGKNRQTLLGVTGSGKTFTMANVIKRLKKKTLVLAHNKTLAAQLYSEFKEFFPENAVEYFVSYYDYYQPEAYVPGKDIYIEKDASINDQIDKLRHSATRSLLERDDVVVISSVSCIYGIGSPAEYQSQKITLLVGDELVRDNFLNRLVATQYERSDMDFYRGTFRVRGDIVEIFPAHEDSNVIRVEFFGDNIEGLYIVDPLRGMILQQLDHVIIYPKSHYVVGEASMKQAIVNIRQELRVRLGELEQEGKLVERQRLEQRTLYDLEMLEEMGYCSGIENYSRHLTGNAPGEPPPTLIDYFGNDFLLIIDESHMTIPQVRGMYRGDRARKETLVNYGFRLPSALDNRPLNFEEFDQRLNRVLYVSATPGDYELQQCQGEYVEQLIRPTGLLDPQVEMRSAATQVDDMLKEVRRVIARNERVLITTLTKRLAEELTNYYKTSGIKVAYLHSDVETLERVEIINDLRAGKYDVLVGINLLREGLDLPEVTLVGIMDADKEGFLRSERALIQTIGRAARNINGRVILYAYQSTGSIERAMKETLRRREIQESYNRQHGIIPQSIQKNISGGVIEAIRGKQEIKSKKLISGERMSVEVLEMRINELRDLMKRASRELRFEDAIKYREEIRELTEARLLL